MKITHNGKEMELTEEQMKVLGLEEPKKYKRWKPEIREKYYAIGEGWFTHEYQWDNTNSALYLYHRGNVYKTMEEAKKARDRQFAIVRVNDRIMELNGNWNPDWKNHSEPKWCVIYDHETGEFFTDSGFNCQFPTTYTKTEAIAEHIIKECEEDLKLIFGIE